MKDESMKGGSMANTDVSTMIQEDGWDLIKIVWTLDGPDDNIVWASHEACKNDRGAGGSRRGKERGNWFPRDNAMFGKCCYCGAKCPESMVVLFHMYNWKFLPHWGQLVGGMPV